MRAAMNIGGHPIHPMLVGIPIGLWIFSFVCDLVFAFGGSEVWKTVGLYTMIGGIVGALLAAVFGFIDMLALKGDPKSTALKHMGLNLTVVVLYVINAWLRTGTDEAMATLPVWLSAVSLVMLVVSGWLGGHMIYKLGVAVDTKPAAEATANVSYTHNRRATPRNGRMAGSH